MVHIPDLLQARDRRFPSLTPDAQQAMLLAGLFSNDPQLAASAFLQLAAMSLVELAMTLRTMDPRLFQHLAASLGGLGAQGLGPGSGMGSSGCSGVPLADLIAQDLFSRMAQPARVERPSSANLRQGAYRPRIAEGLPRAPVEAGKSASELRGSTDGTPVTGARRYPPNSPEAIALFREAANLAGVPESWATSRGLHNILARESGGVVGRPNYTYGARANDSSQWSSIHNELRNGRITARSSATGLGQLLLSNVDRYYPNGRAGIGDPLQEAAGMLRYIKARYGHPDVAWARYNTRHEGY